MSELTGQRIVEVRGMTDEEMQREYWNDSRAYQRPPVLVTEDGSTIYPSMDPEGNGPGALFGYDSETDQGFVVVADE